MSKASELEDLKKRMIADRSLPLKEGATQLVFGDGSAEAKIFFLGEGPGYWEDMKGVPFVGNAGALLNRVLALVKIPREEVFITNVVHYRPPENRDPTPEEMEAFRYYVDRMIEIIDPRLIVTLGRFSLGKFLAGKKISEVHGRAFVVHFGGKKLTVVPMYHPAAALRSGDIMFQFRHDFMKLPQMLEEAEKVTNEESDEERVESDAEQMGLL